MPTIKPTDLNKRGYPPRLVRNIGAGVTMGWHLAATTGPGLGTAGMTGFAPNNTAMAAPVIVRGQFQHVPSGLAPEPFWIPPGYRPTKIHARSTVTVAGGTFRAWHDRDGVRTNMLVSAYSAGVTLTTYAPGPDLDYNFSSYVAPTDFLHMNNWLILEGVGIDLGSAGATRHLDVTVLCEPIAGSTYIQSAMF